MQTMIQPSGIIVISCEVISLSAGAELQRVSVALLYVSDTFYSLLPPLLSPTLAWTQYSHYLWPASPLYSLTLGHPAQSFPHTSVFNQLVPFISGSTGIMKRRLRKFSAEHWETNQCTDLYPHVFPSVMPGSLVGFRKQVKAHKTCEMMKFRVGL